MTIDEQIAILQAAKAGKAIEHFYKGRWEPWGDNGFAFDRFKYRIKREPRELWVYQNERGSLATYPLTKRKPSETNKLSGTYIKFREVLDGDQ